MKKLDNCKIKIFKDLAREVINALKSYNFQNDESMTDAFSPVRLASENIDFLKEHGHEEMNDIYQSTINEMTNGLNYLKGEEYNDSTLWLGFMEQPELRGCYSKS